MFSLSSGENSRLIPASNLVERMYLPHRSFSSTKECAATAFENKGRFRLETLQLFFASAMFSEGAEACARGGPIPRELRFRGNAPLWIANARWRSLKAGSDSRPGPRRFVLLPVAQGALPLRRSACLPLLGRSFGLFVSSCSLLSLLFNINGLLSRGLCYQEYVLNSSPRIITIHHDHEQSHRHHHDFHHYY